jgi:hypothetical protein
MIISSWKKSARNKKNINYLINQESDSNNLKSLGSNKIPLTTFPLAMLKE